MAMMSVGCGARMAVVGNEKTAFVVRQGAFGNDIYRCSAESGRPICMQVQEQ